MGKKQVAVSLRKPPPADPDAFVAGGSDAQAVTPRAEHPTEGPTVVTRVGERREVTVYLPTIVARELSVRCVEVDRDMSSLVTEAVVKMLSIEEPLPPQPVPALPPPPPPAFDRWTRARELVSNLRARLPLGLGLGLGST
jgi:hypothetical protein